MSPAQIVPLVLVPVVAWRLYSRARRNIGPQPFLPRRLWLPILFFGPVLLLIGWLARTHPMSLAALAGGLLAAVPLGLLGLRLTRFDTTEKGITYTPNIVIGISLMVLFAARVGYRMFMTIAYPPPADQPPPSPLESPATLLTLGLIAGYYITYNIGVLLRGKKMGAGEGLGPV